MKLALLADVHANLPAFQAVLEDLAHWQPDRVVFLGDVLNRGARPEACWALLQDKVRTGGWAVLRGNHEEYVASRERTPLEPDSPAFAIAASSWWTYQRLGLKAAVLDALPFSLSLEDPAGGELRLAHASMLGTRAGIYPEIDDEKMRARLGPPGAVLFAAGHTHRPLVRRLDAPPRQADPAGHEAGPGALRLASADATLVVNTGAVGMPFDGDPRAAYARCLWRHGRWEAEIQRLPYDRQETEADFERTGFMANGGPLVPLMLHELRLARPLIGTWAQRYEADCLAGRITVEAAVRRYMDELGLD